MTTVLVCPACGSNSIRTRSETDNFVYRSGGVDYPVIATYPLHVCAVCGESFLGEEGETARHAAICAAMSRLSPAEVVSLRSRLGLSRKALAELSGFGEASLARWESGELIQSESNDNLLRLLTIGENVRALRAIRGSAIAPQSRGIHENAASRVTAESSKVIFLEARFAALTGEDRERASLQSQHFRIKRMAVR